MFTLDQARSFVAVAEELHFGRAAQRLQMTQPPLSRQIQKLERSIGVTLLERDNRTVELTPAGAAFLIEARRLVIAAEQAPLAARRIAEGLDGELRIGFTAASTFGLLGPLLSRISAALPNVTITLHEMVTREQLSALQDGELDLSLARPPFDTEALGSTLLLAEGLLVALPADHPLAALDREITEADLAGLPLIMHSPLRARYFYDLIVRHVSIDHDRVAHTVDQIVTMISLVAAGRGIAFVPESAQRLGIDDVVHRRLAGVAADAVELHAVWSRQATNPVMAHLLPTLLP